MKQTKTKTPTQNKTNKKKNYELFTVIYVPYVKVFNIEASSKKEAERTIKKNMKREVIMGDSVYNTSTYSYDKCYEGFSPIYGAEKKKSMRFIYKN